MTYDQYLAKVQAGEIARDARLHLYGDIEERDRDGFVDRMTIKQIIVCPTPSASPCECAEGWEIK